MRISKKRWTDTEKTLQSIDSTLKRIEQILLKVNEMSELKKLSKELADELDETISRL